MSNHKIGEMNAIKFRAKPIPEFNHLAEKDGFIYGMITKRFSQNTKQPDGFHIQKIAFDKDEGRLIGRIIEVISQTISQFTGYNMFDKEVYFGDLVSNNFGTSKEVIREVVLKDGSFMMKTVKANSRLGRYISLHEFHELNFKVIGNIHDNPELIKN